MNAEVVYIEDSLDNVLNFYIKGYTLTEDGSRIIKAESTVDTSKNKVIFKFFIENQNS